MGVKASRIEELQLEHVGGKGKHCDPNENPKHGFEKSRQRGGIFRKRTMAHAVILLWYLTILIYGPFCPDNMIFGEDFRQFCPLPIISALWAP
jgi:hypothetical protein